MYPDKYFNLKIFFYIDSSFCLYKFTGYKRKYFWIHYIVNVENSWVKKHLEIQGTNVFISFRDLSSVKINLKIRKLSVIKKNKKQIKLRPLKFGGS